MVKELKDLYPGCDVITVSSAGNIKDEQLLDETIVATLIELEHSQSRSKLYKIQHRDAFELGAEVANDLNDDQLANMLLFCTTGINAGKLLEGVNSVISGKVPVAGGIAGDDTRFEKTLVGLNADIDSNHLVALAFYGDRLKASHGSKGGWDAFGPSRKVTRCKGNVLYEIDDQPVLDLYKMYLGDKAAELPASALHFPFAIIDSQTNEYVVRGVQDVDEDENAIILFSDIQEGDHLQLMRANFDRIITGAGDSAKESLFEPGKAPDLAVLISCVARRIVLDQLTEEELSEARLSLGDQCTICGFYSYSELSPIVGDDACHVHNQTMTITTLIEE